MKENITMTDDWAVKNKKLIKKRRQKNEKVTFGDNFFGVGDCRSYSNNGTSEYRYWNFSATHQI
jgi:hypothetical protein